jgi:hypothetical protein
VDPVDLSSNIVSAVTGPQSATADGVSVTQQKAADLIAADQYLAAKAAAASKSRGLRFSVLVPPGAQGGESTT